MTPDQQEARSISLTKGLWCVPLSSGRIAVFDHPLIGTERCVCDSWEEVRALPPREVKAGARERYVKQRAPLSLTVLGAFELDLTGL